MTNDLGCSCYQVQFWNRVIAQGSPRHWNSFHRSHLTQISVGVVHPKKLKTSANHILHVKNIIPDIDVLTLRNANRNRILHPSVLIEK
jgi:hypothetical protein